MNKLLIHQIKKDKYRIGVNSLVFDWEIANFIGITEQKYNKILYDNGAERDEYNRYSFYRRYDAERALEILESILILNKLNP